MLEEAIVPVLLIGFVIVVGLILGPEEDIKFK
jgi:hypothetical protein